MTPKDLSIIIVNYRTYDLTKQTINSVINKNHSFDYDIYVVDSASQDGSLEKLQNDFSQPIESGLINSWPVRKIKDLPMPTTLL